MKALILFFTLLCSVSVLAQNAITYNCSGCFAPRKGLGYTVAETAKNVSSKPLLLETYQTEANNLGVQDGWFDHDSLFPQGVVTLANTKWFLENMKDTTMYWEKGTGISVAEISKDTVSWIDRPSYVYEENDPSKKVRGNERVGVLDISKLLNIYRKDGSPYPRRIFSCLCCQNAVKDQRDLTPPQKPGTGGTITGGGKGTGTSEKPENKTDTTSVDTASTIANGSASNTGGAKKDTVYTPGSGPIVLSTGGLSPKELYEKQQRELARQSLDSTGMFSQTGATNYYIVNSFNTSTYVIPESNSGQQNGGQDSGGQYVYYDGYYYELPPSSNNVCYQNGRNLFTLAAVLNLGGNIRRAPQYSHWGGDRFYFPDGRPFVYQANLGKWELQGGPVYGFDYSWYNNANQWKRETTGYTSNSYHSSTYYGPRFRG